MVDDTPNTDAMAAALAAYTLSVLMLRSLDQSGALPPGDAQRIVRNALLRLERSAEDDPSVATGARELLQGLAADLGVPMTKPQ
ncbi:hypothetical protein [Roseospira goensis]|uniref:DUF1844 domain-containing protein n=1 Tax=Roseospira goensis TaxID=391922 RepID=A0A7W6WMB9_9PROT|nr:hypothetical protein [Roseospira goensis]MBB4287608.1 hypothetical protein [Roseospira goensis]